VPHAQLVGHSPRGRRQVRRLGAKYGQIGRGVAAKERCRDGLTAGQPDANVVVAADRVVGRDDDAVG
jgi:hypothetical protein